MLTELTVRKLKAKSHDRVEIWDEKLPGFGLRASVSGTKTFVLMYYFRGRKRRLTLGRYPIVSLTQARQQAISALAKLGSGCDPQSGPARVAGDYRFAEKVTEFVEAHCNRHNRESHARETERILHGRFVSAWGTRDVREITKGDVLRVLDAIVTAGTPSAANHALSAIRKFFSWAVERGLAELNPCSGISRPAPATARERVLSLSEIGRVWRASGSHGGPYSQIVRLLLLTAQRRGEVVGMRWTELDMASTLWSIPASRTKNKRAQIVPLSPLAMTVLAEAPRHKEFVFPARGNDETTISGFSKMKRAFDETSGVIDWTLHDLRRTAATHMASLGVAPHVIERILNHTSGTLGGVAGIYNRFSYLQDMRSALELWATHVGNIVGNSEPCTS